MDFNVYFSPIKVHFKPLPEFTISPQWFVKQICWLVSGDKVSAATAAAVITPFRIMAIIDSYLISPNVLIPLQALGVLTLASYSSTPVVDRVVNVLFATVILGIFVKYTHDGTLYKLSNDLYSFAKHGEETVEVLETVQFKNVTFYEPFWFLDDPSQMGCIRSAIAFINSIIRRIFHCFFFCLDSTH